MIERLDHVNLRTSRLDEMIAWYGEVLEMHPGPRPDFSFAGAWLYAGDHALVHLVGVSEAPGDLDVPLRLEHAAFSARGFDRLCARIQERGERMDVVKVPGFPIVQVNIWDPDGNHLHVDFDAAETDLTD